MLPRITEVLEIDQITAWQAMLEKLQAALTSEECCYLNVWGSRGVGKTMFLELFYSFINTRDYAVLDILDVKMPYALLKKDIARFLENNAKKKKKKIILLDHLDILNERDRLADRLDFEKMLTDEVRRGGSSIIATSQAKLEWSNGIVRNSSSFFAIQPFSNEDVKKLATAWGLNPSSAYELTFGHPQALFWLGEHHSLNKAMMAERASIFFLEGISEEGKELALFTSLFPGFDTSTIEELLPMDSILRGKRMQEINELISELLKAGLIVRDEENEYYYRYSDGAVRRLLGTFYHRQHPRAFGEIQRLAAGYFQNQVRYTGYLKIAFINVLYHLALSSKSKKEAGPNCLAWLEKNMVLVDDLDQSVMLKGWQSGNGDPSVIEEIKEIIGAKYYKEIRSTIERATSGLRIDEGEMSHG